MPLPTETGTIGRVEAVKNEICIVSGLQVISLNSVVEFSSGVRGMVLGFSGNKAEVIVFKNFTSLKKGDLVKVVDEHFKVNVSEKLLGRTIDPLGDPVDGLGAIPPNEYRNLESPAKPVHARALVNKPLKTGYMVIDTQIPIGLGQRELFLGEKKSGNDDLAIDIICNQAKNKTNVICIYVAIDADTVTTKRRIESMQKAGAYENTVVIAGRTSESASINYIAPMVGVTIAEWFAARGQDVLIVFDNLTRHAKVYRQLSLLLNRPASREAYPGDIFYLHARLLERSGSFNESVGGGTITALPVVETQSEEATDFITTNLMSITDGHVLFKLNLANQGLQPPIDSGFSVSRIGGRAQAPIIRAISAPLKQLYVRYLEVQRYTSFGSDLHEDTIKVLELGKRARRIFYQKHEDGFSPEQELLLASFVVSERAMRWTDEQMPELIAQLLTFANRPDYLRLLQEAYVAPALENAQPLLDEIFTGFQKDDTTLKPEVRAAAITAETETITGLLRDVDTGEKNG